MDNLIPSAAIRPSRKIPRFLAPVTPLSKFLAMTLFITLPFVSFYLGIRYQKSINPRCSQDKIVTPEPTKKAINNSIRELISNRILGKIIFIKDKDLYTYDEKTSEIIRLTNTNSITDFNLDPKSKDIYLLQNGEIYKTGITDTKFTNLTRTNKVTDFQISPDGEYIAYETSTGITPFVMKSDGSYLIAITQPSEDLNIFHSKFSIEKWLLDSNHLLIRGHGMFETTNNFLEVDILKNTVKKFDRYGDYDINDMPEVYYSPDGSKLAYLYDSSIYLAQSDGTHGRKIFGARGLSWFLWSPDSTKMVVQAGIQKDKGESLVIFDGNGDLLFEAINDYINGGYTSPAWSSDGNFLAARKYFDYSNQTKPDNIVLIDVLNKSLKEITPEMKDLLRKSPWVIYIAPSYNVYYVISSNSGDVQDLTLPQLWIWDFISGSSKKIEDHANLSHSNGKWVE